MYFKAFNFCVSVVGNFRLNLPSILILDTGPKETLDSVFVIVLIGCCSCAAFLSRLTGFPFIGICIKFHASTLTTSSSIRSLT